MRNDSSIRCLAVVGPLVALALVVMSCGETSKGADDTKCGTAEAANMCLSARWPRLAVTFGDTGAASLSYAFVVDGQAFPLSKYSCVGEGGQSPAVHPCDVGFPSYPVQPTRGRLIVSATDGGPIQLSVDIALQPFNYCGNGLAQIVVSAGGGGTPTASPVTYVDACSP